MRYTDNQRYSILESFVQRINAEISVENPIISGQYEYIDGLIAEKGKYAIIIENKIWDAVDQESQIERYVSSAENFVSSDKIYVIYLTRDGSKKVEDYSFTAQTKEKIGDRFFPMDYKNDILPWLRDEILPNCKVKEEFLRSAIHQYIDYLEGICGLHNFQQIALKRTLNKLIKEMEIQGNTTKEKYLNLTKSISNISYLQNLLNKEREKMWNVVLDKFTDITQKYFCETYPSEREENQFYIRNFIKNGWYQIYKKCWTWDIHLEWVPFSGEDLYNKKEYCFVLHVEGQCLKNEKFKKILQENEELKVLNNNRINKNVFYSKVFKTKNGVSLSEMSEDEMEEFLYSVYDSDDIKKIIRIVDNALEQYNKQSNKG